MQSWTIRGKTGKQDMLIRLGGGWGGIETLKTNIYFIETDHISQNTWEILHDLQLKRSM